MPQYELSIDPALVAQAESVVTLEGRAFPSIAVHWSSMMLGQQWSTTLVLDYTVPLPPLKHGESFNEVRIAAFTGDVPTKFLYFGNELNEDAPRIGPEMENFFTPQASYQEYRLTEEGCSVPYLELIATTPRVYGNGPQDYYSPPIKIERYDADPGDNLLADNFPNVVAGLPVIPGELLTDARCGYWQGSRFVGQRKIAILRQGKVAGICERTGREREGVPPDVVRRDPNLDVQDAWVAVDFGTSSTVVAIGRAEQRELIRIGATSEPKVSRDFECPSEVVFNNLPAVLKAWSDRVILPLTEWGDVLVGHAARERRLVDGKECALRTKASIAELPFLAERMERGSDSFICGRSDLDSSLKLEPPAPPIIDEEGIDPDDPFDPIELYAYYIGLHLNQRTRGVFLRYAIGVATGWPAQRRQQVLAAFRRGILRSLPAGMVGFDDLKRLQIVDGGPNVLSFAAHAFRVFGIAPRGTEAVPFVSIDAGASECAVLVGQYRQGTVEEVAAGLEKVIEHVDPVVLPHLGGEKLLHRLAYKVYAASGTSMRYKDVPFEPPAGEDLLDGAEDRLHGSFHAQVNARLLKDAVRPVLESQEPQPLPDMIPLFSSDGRVCDVRIMVDRAALSEWLRSQLSAAAAEIKDAIVKGFSDVTRDSTPYDELRVLMGGRLGMHPVLWESIEAVLPEGVKVHRFREPDETNLMAPTVKIATAFGILAMRQQQMGPAQVTDDRAAFRYRVGRAKRGVLLTVLDASTGYDSWREFGACTKPEVTVLYTDSGQAGELAADDASIRRVVCNLGFDAVGYRVYVRAISSTRVEVSVGPPGGRPEDDAAIWSVDLVNGTAEPASSWPLSVR